MSQKQTTSLQQRLINLIFSTRLMAMLFIAFAVAMGIGTFIENDHGTPAARILVYNAWWFEAIMVLFVINFIGNIKRYQLYKKEKWMTLTLHLSFILILIGAFVTRYIGYEGMMPISEGETTNQFLSQKTYITTLIDGSIDGELMRKTVRQPVEFSEYTQRQNNFTYRTDFKGQPITIKYKKYIKGAEEGLVPSEDGDLHLKMVEAGGGQRHDHYLKAGEVSNIHNILFAFNKPTPGAINIGYDNGKYTIDAPFEGTYMRMADQKQGAVAKDSLQPLQMRSLYNMAGTQFVFPEDAVKGVYDVMDVPNEGNNPQNALILEVSTNGETKEVKLLGGQGYANNLKEYSIGGLDFKMAYGSKSLELPFSLKLNDFIADKYPGTDNVYSAYKSKLEVVDDGKNEPYEIFMNHVLDHKGYRFFQASFPPDEKGTILSVNYDFWGTWITYIGYFLLYIGLMGILLIKGSRFKDLEEMLKGVKLKKAALSVLILLGGFFASDIQAQTSVLEAPQRPNKKQLDSIIKSNAVSVEHAEKFGSLVIQDDGGRMKPINTFSSELLRKLSKKDNYQGLTSDQVMLSMIENPFVWYNVPIIYIKKENDSIRKILGTPKGEKRVALIDLFDKKGNYKLEPYLQQASSTNTPSNFEKDFLRTHEKFYLLNSALSGGVLSIFPKKDDPNNKWFAPPALNEAGFKGVDSVFTKHIVPIYKESLVDARKSGNYKKADEYLTVIKNFQKKYGSDVMPSDKKIQTEILYNKYDIFKKLFVYYMLGGLALLIFVILNIFWDNKFIRLLVGIGKIAILLMFFAHTAGLIYRWYISGHAPWSDAYESMIYVAWATQFFGLALGRKSDLTIGATAFVTSIILMVAHWSWMDPAIANLQPVLNSYWLMIHVAVIVASYGPFILGAILGALALLLIIFTTKKNKKKMALNIKEITIVNEMALTIGLVMLTIGNFLGGQWANESWGRYWGWDPKETWALISIMVYAFVIHMRYVPGLRGRWWFNFISLGAIASIMMTYFGVNFYLSGLHSYASGDQAITPQFVWNAVVIVLVLGAVSFWRYRVHYKK